MKYMLFSLLMAITTISQAQVYVCKDGQVNFESDAPLELIQAQSKTLRGALDAQERTFAFTIDINSFEGFNSPLQREHFNENYMEAARFPKATFIGKIIESVDFTQPGTYILRAKGRLNIHGIEQERIIKSQVVHDADGSHDPLSIGDRCGCG